MSGGGRPPVAPRLPLPQSAAHPRLHPHRSLLHHLRLGFVSTPQRRRQTAPRPRGRARTERTPGAAHQPAPFPPAHRRRNLSRALADRGLLPRPQTNSARENLRRHQRQCPEGADLDSTHRHAAAQVSATAQPFPLVAFQPRRPAAPATVCLSRLVALDRPTLPAARDAAAACPTSAPAARLNQFGQPMLNLNQKPRSKLALSPKIRDHNPRSPLTWTALRLAPSLQETR